jgi:hypothetical protein
VDDQSFAYFAENGSTAWRKRAEKIIQKAGTQTMI